RTEQDKQTYTMHQTVNELGETAISIRQAITHTTTLTPYTTDIYAAADHLVTLTERYNKVPSAVHAAIDKTDNAGDVDTADLFTSFSRALDKNLWFLEAHLQ